MTLPRFRQTVLTTAATSAILLTAACGSDATDSASGSGSDGDSGSTEASAEEGTDGGAASGSGVYAPGDYSAEGSYNSPGGQQSVVVDVTLEADGTITAVTVEPQADGGNSKQYQERFASGIAAEVEGKKIDDLKVSKVSGSSLTSGGFNAAIDEIKGQAAA